MLIDVLENNYYTSLLLVEFRSMSNWNLTPNFFSKFRFDNVGSLKK